MTIPSLSMPQPSALAAQNPVSQQAKKLHQAADEFEGMLISTLWKSLEDDPLTAPDDSDPGSNTMQGLGLQAMSTALASSGGLGIARMIEHQLTPAAPPSPTPPAGLEPLKFSPVKSDTMLVAKRPSAAVVEDVR